MKWAFPQLRGDGYLLRPPDNPGTFPFPTGLPTPQGKPVVMAEADGAWTPMYETKTPDKTAETLASEMKKVAALVESGTYSQDDGSWDATPQGLDPVNRLLSNARRRLAACR